MTTRLRVELGLVLSFLRNGSGQRAALIAASTALVSGLLLVALTVALFTWRSSPEAEQLGNLVADGGVRGGYVFALLLICVAPLGLLRQVVRLGTASRERRLAALRLAGATPAEVRRMGALEVGMPALVGGLGGYLVFAVLRLAFGGMPLHQGGGLFSGSGVRRELRVVPVTVAPSWWQVVLVALAVGLVGALAGTVGSRAMLVSPLGVSRREPRSAPRPWGLAFLALAFVLRDRLESPGASDSVAVAFVGSLVLGLLLLAPWVAHWVGRAVARRASNPHVLIAARRLVHDSRPAGRAAAAVGAIGLVAGGGGAMLAALPGDQGSDLGQVNPIYTVPIAMGGAVLLVSLVLVVFSIAVHGMDTLMDRKRSMASLAALGTSPEELERVQRWEVGLVALPMVVLGVLIGSGPFLFFLLFNHAGYAWIAVFVDAATVAVVAAAVRTSTRVTRPWMTRAVAATNLRTE